jgi:hypothetical protein
MPAHPALLRWAAIVIYFVDKYYNYYHFDR